MRREMEKPVSSIITCLAVALATAGCGFHHGSVKENGKVEVTVTEQAVRTIALEGDITQKWAEVSGLAWYGDNLIILPQYPGRFTDEGRGYVFAIPKERIIAFLDGHNSDPIVPVAIRFEAPDLQELIPHYNGFEAIAFQGERAFFTIESKSETESGGYMAVGTMAQDLSVLKLDAAKLVPVPHQVNIHNLSAEALLIAGDKVLTIHEANGANVNPDPVTHLFDFELNLHGTLPFPTIEYRVTDATDLDNDGRFWVVNFFYPPEKDVLDPARDCWRVEYGVGSTHANCLTVERLVELHYTEAGVVQTDSAPILLELVDRKTCRNWEGLVRLDELGFLLMTDKYPETILAFVAKH